MAVVIPALGTTLSYSTTADGTYTTVGNILSVGYPSASVEAVDTGNLGTFIKTSRPGQVDPGEVGFDLQYDPGDTTHAALRKYVTGETPPAVLYWRVISPTTPAKGEQFPGFLTECSPAAEDANGNLEGSATIKVAGAITAYAAGGGGG
ncbi:MAG: hypothetical protein BGO49_08550 [Planctomycetales bacterium 71-10]|nr:MAG: hypothetical protein BGO49_08550 [Planctomycetales bacterium 71-10]